MNLSLHTVANQGLGSRRELDSLTPEALGTFSVSEVPASTSSPGNTEVSPSGKKGAKGRKRVGTTYPLTLVRLLHEIFFFFLFNVVKDLFDEVIFSFCLSVDFPDWLHSE